MWFLWIRVVGGVCGVGYFALGRARLSWALHKFAVIIEERRSRGPAGRFPGDPLRSLFRGGRSGGVVLDTRGFGYRRSLVCGRFAAAFLLFVPSARPEFVRCRVSEVGVSEIRV